jgi:hypothetical protein
VHFSFYILNLGDGITLAHILSAVAEAKKMTDENNRSRQGILFDVVRRSIQICSGWLKPQWPSSIIDRRSLM